LFAFKRISISYESVLTGVAPLSYEAVLVNSGLLKRRCSSTDFREKKQPANKRTRYLTAHIQNNPLAYSQGKLPSMPFFYQQNRMLDSRKDILGTLFSRFIKEKQQAHAICLNLQSSFFQQTCKTQLTYLNTLKSFLQTSSYESESDFFLGIQNVYFNHLIALINLSFNTSLYLSFLLHYPESMPTITIQKFSHYLSVSSDFFNAVSHQSSETPFYCAAQEGLRRLEAKIEQLRTILGLIQSQ